MLNYMLEIQFEYILYKSLQFDQMRPHNWDKSLQSLFAISSTSYPLILKFARTFLLLSYASTAFSSVTETMSDNLKPERNVNYLINKVIIMGKWFSMQKKVVHGIESF